MTTQHGWRPNQETAVIYCRVSTEEQGKGYSLATQLDECRRLCQSRGYAVVGEYLDEFTGIEHERPGIAAMMEAVVVGRPHVVVALDVDRLLGREELAQALIKHEVLGTGARIEYAHGGGHTIDNTDGEIFEGFKALWARHENAQRIERSRRGKRGRVEAGNVLITGQRAPFGYDYVSEPHRGQLVVNEAEAAVVRDVYHWLVVEGLSSYAIARRLWETGILTSGDKNGAVYKKAGRGEWSASTVRRLVSSPVYKGEWYYGTTRRTKRAPGAVKPTGEPFKTKHVSVPVPPDQWLKVDVPAIVNAATWERAQARLVENRQLAKRNTRHEYLLRGMVFCACGRRWTGRYKKHVDRAYYRCPSTDAEYWRLACDTRFSLRQDTLEVAVWACVTDYLLHPEALMADVERRRAERAGEFAQRERKVEALRRALADVDRKLGQLLDQALEGFPANLVEAKKRELLVQRQALEAERHRLDAMGSDPVFTPDVAAMLQELAATVGRALPAMTFEEKRQLLILLRVRVEVLDRDRVMVSGLLSESVVDISS